MKILITGHNGFIGQNVLKHLMHKGHTAEGYEYVAGKFPDTVKYDQVIHLGAISSTVETNVEKIMLQNYDFSMQLIKKCINAGVPFQYASSASVYGNTDNFSESSAKNPNSAYAWSKYLFDREVETLLKIHPKAIIQGFRYFNVYGSGETHKQNQASPISKFILEAKTKGTVTIFENSENYLRDFVCVTDVCEIHDQMLHKKVSGIFNVGTSIAISFADIAQIISQKYQAKIVTVPMPNMLTHQYQTYTCADNSLLNTHVNIQFKTIKEYIEHDCN